MYGVVRSSGGRGDEDGLIVANLALRVPRHGGSGVAGGRQFADVRERQLGHADIRTTEHYYGHLERHVLAAGAVATEEALPAPWRGVSRKFLRLGCRIAWAGRVWGVLGAAGSVYAVSLMSSSSSALACSGVGLVRRV